jgi:hypothetical protein
MSWRYCKNQRSISLDHLAMIDLDDIFFEMTHKLK